MAPIEQCSKLALDPSCDRCALAKQADLTSICVPADGEPGGVLIIGEAPGRVEDRANRPFVGTSGAYLRDLVNQAFTRSVAYGNACGCFPGKKPPTPKQIESCRPYLAALIEEVKPERILVLGATACCSVIGKVLSVLSCRRAYSFLSDGTPVFILMHPAAALRNRFFKNWFEADLKWALTADRPVPDWDGTACIVESQQDAESVLALARSVDWVTFDCETFGQLWEPDFRLLSVAIAPKGSQDSYVWDEPALAAFYKPLEQLFSDPAIRKVGQHIQFDLQAIKCELGVQIPRESVHLDTRLLRRLIDAEAEADLATMAFLVGAGGHKDEAHAALNQVLGRTKKATTLRIKHGKVGAAIESAYERGIEPKVYAFAAVPRDLLSRYNALDTIATDKLAVLFEKKIQTTEHIAHVWNSVVGKASYSVARMEEWGFPVDVPAIRMFGDRLREDIHQAEVELGAYGDFDPGSSKQVGSFLFDECGLRPKKFSDKTGAPSTDADVLEALKGKHPVVDLLLKHRHLSKLRNTYADGEDGRSGLLKRVRQTGKIHFSYDIAGARSGRLSGDGQQFPRAETPEGVIIRNFFIAPEGYVLIQHDFSQLEFRIGAMLSGDKVMIDIVKSGTDFHTGTAKVIAPELWNCDFDSQPPAKQKWMRSQAKTSNFLTFYGGSPEALAIQLGCTVAEATRLQNFIMGKFSTFKSWIQESIRYTLQTGYTWTWWDGKQARRRPMFRIADQDPAVRSRAEHGSFNSRVQGTASEYCLASCNELVAWIDNEDLESEVTMPLTVHDSVLFIVKEALVDRVVKKGLDVMLSWNSAGVPLAVDVEIGKAWGSLKKI